MNGKKEEKSRKALGKAVQHEEKKDRKEDEKEQRNVEARDRWNQNG
jgi:hypothetical protein